MTSNTTHIPQRVIASSIEEFNSWYEKHTYGSTLAVGGRYETRNGQMFCLGGLSWSLHIKAIEGGPVTVTLDTAEDETLPDLPVVRVGFPYGLNRNARRAVAA